MRPSRVDTSEPACDEPEDVVDEEQHVLLLHVTEVLGHGQRRQGDPEAHARRLVHLAEAEGGLLEHAGLSISMRRSVPSRVRSPTPANTDTPPWFWATRRIISVMSTVLPTPAPAEQADLAALLVGREQVDDLDAGLEHDADGSRSSNVGASRWMSQWPSICRRRARGRRGARRSR
jgi:hypothetical protein